MTVQDRDAVVLMTAVVVTAAAARTAGYLLGRLRPWRRAGDWAANQVHFTGAWVRGGVVRQALCGCLRAGVVRVRSAGDSVL
ncbi:hypothetical protein [Streptomyces sp. NPDC057910]|uniref:hypothetical protein n=1 Tax=Streptomyces sp. NPDC057910 TaxID=3346278 RepID=UPI0036E101E1